MENTNINLDSNYNKGSAFDRDVYVSGSSMTDRESWRVMGEKFYNDLLRLWEKESRLISAELSEKVTEAKTAAVSMASGGVVLFVGVLSLAATAIIVLDRFLPLWAAAAIVTAALSVIGGIMVAGAKKKFENTSLKPRHSIDALGEIKTSIQERIHEFQRH